MKRTGEVKDFNGTMFPNEKEMCRYYGIEQTTFRSRIKHGIDLKNALTVSPENIVSDHLGNKYRSLNEMCGHYNIETSTYQARIRSGMSVKDALTIPVQKQRSKKDGVVKDHLGNEYRSISEMCRKYDISLTVFCNRIKRGIDLKEALTKPSKDPVTKKSKYVSPLYAVKDFNGIEYASTSEMCRHYHIDPSVFTRRIQKGMDFKDALTKPTQNKVCDHLGNSYKNLKEMCDKYGVSFNTYLRRIKAGKSVEEALTGAVTNVSVDHLGNRFRTFEEMCRFHGVEDSTVRYRLSHGRSLAEALTEGAKLDKDDIRSKEKIVVSGDIVTDCFGTRFDTVEEMCKAYHVKRNSYIGRIKAGYTKEEALRLIPFIGSRIHDLKIDDHLFIKKCICEKSIGSGCYDCIMDGKNILLMRDEIVEYCKTHIMKKQ